MSISPTLNVQIFLYEHHFGNVHVTRLKLPKPTLVRKICAFNVDEIDTRSAQPKYVSWRAIFFFEYLRAKIQRLFVQQIIKLIINNLWVHLVIF